MISQLLDYVKILKTICQMNTEQLDAQVGIERIYTTEQLTRLLKDLPPFYYKPSLEQIQALPNEAQTIRRYGD